MPLIIVLVCAMVTVIVYVLATLIAKKRRKYVYTNVICFVGGMTVTTLASFRIRKVF